MTAVVNLTIGAAGALCNDARSEQWLTTAIRQGEDCGDRYVPCLGRLWLAWAAIRDEDWETCSALLSAALATMQTEGYEFLVAATPFLGFKQAEQRIELLQAAATAGIASDYVRPLLQRLMETAPNVRGRPFGLFMPSADDSDHPPLYVQILGPLRVWRGFQEVSADDWSGTQRLASGPGAGAPDGGVTVLRSA